MRLIDADKLLAYLNDCALSASPSGRCIKNQMIARVEYDAIQNCIKAVEERPTAYDVDAVIERLKGRREAALQTGNSITLGDVYGLETAMEIVKQAANKSVDPLVGVSVEQLKNELSNQ